MVKIETINKNDITSFQLVPQDMSSTNRQNLILSSASDEMPHTFVNSHKMIGYFLYSISSPTINYAKDGTVSESSAKTLKQCARVLALAEILWNIRTSAF